MNMKKLIALLMAVAMIAVFAVGCSDTNTSTNTNTNANTDVADAPEDAGFEEIGIFEDEEVADLMNVNAVYFQPVPMVPGNENFEDYDLHLECDVSALDGNTLGYEAGGWIPYLTVDYKVIASDGSTAAEGTFMVMAASDGPHYGANIKLPNADTYSLEFTFHSPAENGYMVHGDAVTGPGGLLDDYWGNGPLTLRVDDCWDYTPVDWDNV